MKIYFLCKIFSGKTLSKLRQNKRAVPSRVSKDYLTGFAPKEWGYSALILL